jgi:hypothetical protein
MTFHWPSAHYRGGRSSLETEIELCTYCVSTVFCSLEMDHAIETGVRSVVALIAMGIEFFLRKNVSASLDSHEYFAIAHGGSLRSGA